MPVEILLVEDNEGDIRLTKEAFRESMVWNHMNVVRDGAEALAFLRREGKYTDAIRPGIILLDLNLPKRSGIEVLEEIKRDDELKHIPVVVLTSSQAEQDILNSYNFHANCFISKPLDLEQFLQVVQSIKDFWLTIVKLPPAS
ncbi:response regulator [Trichocoleus sp. FACHB-6]|uniref:response regulator n=1 Tax=Cyanophyceae TaxID=3028117 RepID=UPI001683EB97|nr:response regulator [Trichocoleus sp. FACHB-832]MBD2061048.1 response regulator [Trichocoleus sp. FACHB-6]